jgi:hypothetical protein
MVDIEDHFNICVRESGTDLIDFVQCREITSTEKYRPCPASVSLKFNTDRKIEVNLYL